METSPSSVKSRNLPKSSPWPLKFEFYFSSHTSILRSTKWKKRIRLTSVKTSAREFIWRLCVEFKFGPTYVVEPKEKHLTTIVWLHGLGDDGSSWSQLFETLPLPNIKWIFPTSPTQPVTLFGGLATTAWFDVIGMSEDASQDVEGMDASAAHVLSLLSTEPPNVKLGVGGFSMGAATAIYSASCFARGKFGNGTDYSTHLNAVVALSGWLPCAQDLRDEVEDYEGESRAASLPILLCHGRGDDVVWFRYGEKSAEKLSSAGFENLTFKSFQRLGHNIIPEEMDEVSSWLTSKLELEEGQKI